MNLTKQQVTAIASEIIEQLNKPINERNRALVEEREEDWKQSKPYKLFMEAVGEELSREHCAIVLMNRMKERTLGKIPIQRLYSLAEVERKITIASIDNVNVNDLINMVKQMLERQ